MSTKENVVDICEVWVKTDGLKGRSDGPRAEKKKVTSGKCMSSNTREKVKGREMFREKHEAKDREVQRS